MQMTYLDYNATTPLEPRAFEAMVPWMTERFWNSASSHAGGRLAHDAVEFARRQVAQLVGARPGGVVWTSGATEANNLALKGVLEHAPAERRRVLTVATEHKAVLDTVSWLSEQRAVPVTVLPVDRRGQIDTKEFEQELERGDVAIVSVMAANNETGATADLGPLVRLAHEAGALFHTDLTQAVGRMPFDLGELGVDLASLSSHKIYGPKGVGALVVAGRLGVAPQMHGGGHEGGLRSGTLNVPGIVGFGVAADHAGRDLDHEMDRQRRLLDRFEAALSEQLGGVEVNSDHHSGLPNTLNVRIVGADSEAVMANAPDVAMSSGSACTARVPSPSHVLLAMGRSAAEASECLRITVGRPTTPAEIDVAAESIIRAATRVRRMQ